MDTYSNDLYITTLEAITQLETKLDLKNVSTDCIAEAAASVEWTYTDGEWLSPEMFTFHVKVPNFKDRKGISVVSLRAGNVEVTNELPPYMVTGFIRRLTELQIKLSSLYKTYVNVEPIV